MRKSQNGEEEKKYLVILNWGLVFLGLEIGDLG